MSRQPIAHRHKRNGTCRSLERGPHPPPGRGGPHLPGGPHRRAHKELTRHLATIGTALDTQGREVAPLIALLFVHRLCHLTHSR